MADNRKLFTIKAGETGEIKTTEEVVTIIAGLAATEVEGVNSLGGNITNDMVSKLGIKHLAKGVSIQTEDGEVCVDLTLNISYGYSIPEICDKIQERVISSVETMTGLHVSSVDIRIASVLLEDN